MVVFSTIKGFGFPGLTGVFLAVLRVGVTAEGLGYGFGSVVDLLVFVFAGFGAFLPVGAVEADVVFRGSGCVFDLGKFVAALSALRPFFFLLRGTVSLAGPLVRSFGPALPVICFMGVLPPAYLFAPMGVLLVGPAMVRPPVGAPLTGALAFVLAGSEFERLIVGFRAVDGRALPGEGEGW